MNKHGERLVAIKVLMVDHELNAPTATGRAARALVEELKSSDVVIVESISAEDGESIVLSDPSIQCILLDWDLGDDEHLTHVKAKKLLELIRSRYEKIPIFLIAEPADGVDLSAEVMQMADELIWLLQDTTFFIAGRIIAAAIRYRDQLAPPFSRALMEFARVYEYSWHTPGHAGGTAFLKSPVGRAFYEYFGENLLRSDLSISVGELGSLLDHSGPIGDSEKYAAKIFGAHRSYSVTNGTSTSNRIICMASVTQGDAILVDRNCHKSIEQALTMTGAIPTYLVPSRNYLGIIGPIYPECLAADAIQSSIKNNPLVKSEANPKHVVVTNSTYDGLCYLATRVVELLDKSVDRIHFDEAWYGYARFNPLYRDRYGMYGNPADYPKNKPTIFSTTSTHKLLAALSQASLIHVRDGRDAVDHARFNESFMMHASTSPQYAIICSNEISAAMMEGTGGLTLTMESIREAVTFRQTMRRFRRDKQAQGDWFFNTWNADEVKDPATGKLTAFEDAPESLLVSEPDCWVLHPGDAWHGFKDLEDGYCMLDPIKVSIVSPGVNTDNTFEDWGIPATLVTAYLDHRGIVVEKTTDFTILFLFSIGVTKAKSGSLINALLDFKNDFDHNTPLADVLPSLIANYPDRYHDMGLKDLATEMLAQMKESKLLRLQAQAFSNLPQPELTPDETYQRLVHNQVKQVAVDKMDNHIVATGVVPYPPGIPMIMPGENAGPKNGPYLGYLRALQAWDRRFPGFGHETHGVDNKNGTYYIYCLK
jgi:arginine decarboxylase